MICYLLCVAYCILNHRMLIAIGLCRFLRSKVVLGMGLSGNVILLRLVLLRRRIHEMFGGSLGMDLNIGVGISCLHFSQWKCFE